MTATAATFTRADVTLYLIERAGGANAGGESRLALGRDATDREAQNIGSGHPDVVSVSPLAWDSPDEADALFLTDDVDAVLADAFVLADALGLDYEPGRCDVYALLLAVRAIFERLGA
jgi:hypothetical protein